MLIHNLISQFSLRALPQVFRNAEPRTGRCRRMIHNHAHLVAEPDSPLSTPCRNPTASVLEVLPQRIPFLNALAHLKNVGFSDLLRAAHAENNPEAFKEIVLFLLNRLEIEVPDRVFVRMRRRKPGRRISGEGEKVFALWREIGEPSPHTAALAKAFFGKEYNDASGTTRRKMRDRVREHLMRQLDREIARKEDEIARKEVETPMRQNALDNLQNVDCPRHQAILHYLNWMSRAFRPTVPAYGTDNRTGVPSRKMWVEIPLAFNPTFTRY